MKVYITKYALTKGVIVFEGEMYDSELKNAFRGKRTPKHYDEYFNGKDVHFTKESALKQCEEMKIKKLQSLDKQVKKISAIEFSIDEEL